MQVGDNVKAQPEKGDVLWCLKSMGHEKFRPFVRYSLVEYQWLGTSWKETGNIEKATLATIKERRAHIGVPEGKLQRKKSATGKENILLALRILEKDQTMSVRALAAELGISKTSAGRIKEVAVRFLVAERLQGELG